MIMVVVLQGAVGEPGAKGFVGPTGPRVSRTQELGFHNDLLHFTV